MPADITFPGDIQLVLPRIYSPTFYFRQWEGKDGKLCETVNIDGTLAQIRKPIEEARLSYALFTSQTEFAADDHEIIRQKFFESLDQAGDEVIEKILESQPLSVGETLFWAQFIASMHPRVCEPVYRVMRRSTGRRHTGNVRPKLAPSTDLQFIETIRTQHIDYQADQPTDANARWREISKSDVPDSVFDNGVHDIAVESETVRRILAMDWYALDISTSRRRLLTSDQPCVFTRGIGDPDCVITLPLSPSRALFAMHSTSTKYELLGITAAGKLSAALNSSTVAKAVRSAYSRQETDAPERFLRQHVPFSRAE